MGTNQILQVDRRTLEDCIRQAIKEVLKKPGRQKETGDPLLSFDEAAHYLKLSRSTLYTYTARKSIPFIKKGKKLLFRKSKLDEWLNG